MSKRKMIENPEVPGLEENFPSSSSIMPKIQIKTDDNLSDMTLPSTSTPAPSPVMANPYFISTSSQKIPWWVASVSDTKETSFPWIDKEQNINFAMSQLETSKIERMKRKIDSVDPIQNDERAAHARRELNALMKPLKCDLCNALMNSTSQAKWHYEGKQHQKKVSGFLNHYVKKLKTEDGEVGNTATNNWSTYCDICKTFFTSQTDATQHYEGKKHIKALTVVTKQKCLKKPQNEIPMDTVDRFGIGLAFRLEYEPITNNNEVSDSLSISNTPLITGFANNATNYGAALRCDLCGVAANRLEQLEIHRRGARHQKMLRMKGDVSTNPLSSQIECSTASTMTLDYSICRTPSGLYYCATCDKSFTSENDFTQHMESKKHKNQVNLKVPANQSPANVKKQNKTK